MSEWKECKLGQLIDNKSAELQTGPFGTMLNASEYVTDGTPVIAVQDIGENKLVYHKFVYVNDTTAKRLSRYKVKENDIIFGRKGAVERRALIKEMEQGWLQGSDCIRLRFLNTIDPKFASYQFGTNVYQEWMFQNAGGATMPSLNQSILRELPIRHPNLPEQTAIASVLSSLDNKIDLLHRQNATLEKMAETLFRQWFVEEAKDDWEEVELGKLLDVVIDNRGKTPPTVEFKTEYPLIEVNALNSQSCLVDYTVVRKYVTKETFDTWFRKHLKVNDIIISTVGTIGVFSIHLANKGCIAQNLVGLRSSRISSYFLYCFFKSNIETLMNLDIGGVQPSIKVPHLLGLTIKLPPTELLNKFNERVEIYFNKIAINQTQIRTLTALRDSLLPKLMSGDVKVVL